MKSKLSISLVAILFSFQTAFGALTHVPDVSKSREKAAEKALKMTKNVRVDKLLDAVEPFLSSNDYEALLKSLDSKAKKMKLDSIMHGKDFFYIQSGDIKVVFKWVNKDGVAFKVNGKPFSYEEASKTEIWQPKVQEIVKSMGQKNRSASIDVPVSVAAITPFALIELLFQPKESEAFLTNPWVLGGIGIAAIGLIGLSFYNNHKDEHAKKMGRVQTELSMAKDRLEKRRAEELARGNENPDLSAYEKSVIDLENLAAEYGTTSEDVGFFGYLFGKRIKTPASYFRHNLPTTVE